MSELRKEIEELVNGFNREAALLLARIDAIEEAQEPEQPEFEYPIVCRDKTNGNVLMYTGVCEATVLFSSNGMYKVGSSSSDWIEHTHEYMEQIPYDKERGLYHKQVVEINYNDRPAIYELGVWNSDPEYRCLFSSDGRAANVTICNGYVEPYTGEITPRIQSMIDACED